MSTTSTTDTSPAGRSTPEPKRLLIVTALAVFIGEVVVMLVLAVLPPMPMLAEALADGVMITILAAPALYLFLFRPMREHLESRRQAEDELRLLNEQLEGLVGERTANLELANRQLAREVETHRSTAESLRRSNEFIVNVVERAPCLVVTFDAESLRCIYVNSRITDILGRDQDEISVSGGTLVEDCIDARDRAAFLEVVRELVVAPEGEIVRGTCGFVSADGKVIQLRYAVTVLGRTATMEPKDLLLAGVPAES